MSDEARQDRTVIQAIRGTKDIFGDEARAFQFVEAAARELFALYGYSEIRTPVLEATELFARSVGEASDIVVSKQMYTFTDPGDRSNTMRPEGTAGVIRALVECGAFKETSQQKVWYTGPMFRYEKPQKGRLRQFTQIGAEFFGVAHPGADAEIIILSAQLLRQLGFTDLVVKVNNIGDRESRAAYNAALREAIAAGSAWCEQCAERARVNPMRVFDCKVEACQGLVAKLPRVRDFLNEASQAHDQTVQGLLAAAGVPYEMDTGLVRGLDYYSQTVFEVVSGAIGAQNAVLGGGRYDYLVEELGGPATPGVGMSIGVERLVLAMEAAAIQPPPDPKPEFYLLALDEESLPTVARLALKARTARTRVVFDCQPRSARAGLKAANRVGATAAILIGSDELERGVGQWKNLEGGEQVELSLAEIESNLTQ
jgi:histidyl-tRNA synthetase